MLKAVDESLWSFGKWLKDMRKEEKITANNQSNKPNHEFKQRVMVLIEQGFTQRKAIEEAAVERGIKLQDSYYMYPASYIGQWKKQGY